jgi:hypothetical protein
LHDLERQGAIGWPFAAKIIVRLGCQLDDRFDTEALVSSFAEAEEWLREAEHLPPGSKSRPPTIVDELFAAGVPVTALWVFDRLFQATFAPPEDTMIAEDWVRADSWAELEEVIRTEAYRRWPDRTRGSLAPARTQEAMRRIDERREAAAKPTVPTHLMKIAAPVRETPRGQTASSSRLPL